MLTDGPEVALCNLLRIVRKAAALDDDLSLLRRATHVVRGHSGQRVRLSDEQRPFVNSVLAEFILRVYDLDLHTDDAGRLLRDCFMIIMKNININMNIN